MALKPLDGPFMAQVQARAHSLITPDAEPDHLLGQVMEQKLRLQNTHLYLREQAGHWEQLSNNRELSPAERRHAHYVASSMRLAMTCLADSREWAEKLATSRKG